jgi:hypothetical protein
VSQSSTTQVARAVRGGSDWTDCIASTLDSLGQGGTLQFKRGEEYLISGRVLVLDDDVTLEAVGSGARPIIKFTADQAHGAIGIAGANVKLLNLDIRGPYYNLQYYSPQNYYGISAAGSPAHNLHLEGLSINGFASNGVIQIGDISGVQVKGCDISFNGSTGIALFVNDLDNTTPSDVLIQGTTLSNNGQDGIDCHGSGVEISVCSIHTNGWGNFAGDGHGILLNGYPGISGVLIKGNHINQNRESGIMLLGDGGSFSYDDVHIEDNYLLNNGTGGAQAHGYGLNVAGPITNSSMDRNDAFGNDNGR